MTRLRMGEEVLNLKEVNGVKKKILPIFLALSLVAAVLSAACAPAPAPAPEVIELTFAGFTPPGTLPAYNLDRWAEEVEKRTNGQVKVTVYHAASLLNPKNMMEGVIEGVADCGTMALAYTPGRFPLLEIVDQPHGWTHTVVSTRVLWDLYQKFKPASFADVKVLFLYTSTVGKEAAGFYTKFPVRKIDDLKGHELRATGVGSKALELLGGTPVAMPMPEVYEALAKGIVEGVYTGFDILKGYKHAELVDYVTEAPAPPCSFYGAMNLDTWNSLPKDVQDVIDGLGEEHSIWCAEEFHRTAVEGYHYAIEEEGCEAITLPESEKARMMEIFKPLIDDYLANTASLGLPGQECLDEMFRLKDKYEAMYK